MFSAKKLFFTSKKTGGFYCLGGPECDNSCQYISDIDNFLSPCTISGPFATEQECLGSCAGTSSSSSVGACLGASFANIDRKLEFYDSLPSSSAPSVSTVGRISRQMDRVNIYIDSVVSLNITVGKLLYAPMPYSWPNGDQSYWSDTAYPFTLRVSSVNSSVKMSGGQIVGYVYTLLAECYDVPNLNSITTPVATIGNFRTENSIYKADFGVSATISDSKYETDPEMMFYIEYQSPGCADWHSVFNALPPDESPTNGKPKTFSQSYTVEFYNSANCRVTTKDGLLGVPYGGKMRVKATHGPLILFSNEIQLP